LRHYNLDISNVFNVMLNEDTLNISQINAKLR